MQKVFFYISFVLLIKTAFLKSTFQRFINKHETAIILGLFASILLPMSIIIGIRNYTDNMVFRPSWKKTPQKKKASYFHNLRKTSVIVRIINSNNTDRDDQLMALERLFQLDEHKLSSFDYQGFYIKILNNVDFIPLHKLIFPKIKDQKQLKEYILSISDYNMYSSEELALSALKHLKEKKLMNIIAKQSKSSKIRQQAYITLGETEAAHRESLIQSLQFSTKKERVKAAKELISIADTNPDLLLDIWDYISWEIEQSHNDGHKDHSDSHGHDCYYHDDHHVDSGIGLTFPPYPKY